MRDMTSVYSDILFYTKELERIECELKSKTLSDTARSRLTGDMAKIKSRLDALVEKIPEISEN